MTDIISCEAIREARQKIRDLKDSHYEKQKEEGKLNQGIYWSFQDCRLVQM